MDRINRNGLDYYRNALVAFPTGQGGLCQKDRSKRGQETRNERNVETSKRRNVETQKRGNAETQKRGNAETQKRGNVETQKRGNVETQKRGNAETQTGRSGSAGHWFAVSGKARPTGRFDVLTF